MESEVKRTVSEGLDDGSIDDVLAGGEVQCVFSSQEMVKVGTGTTTRRHITKLYWYVESVGHEEFSARQINSNHVPAGEEKRVGLTELLENYLPEIAFWEEDVIPAMQELATLLEDGEADREDGKLYSAERSFQKALTIEEQNVRALFNLGLIYLELEAMEKARDMMNELLNLKTPFIGKDQHLFNDLGISLRKNGLFDEAVAYYSHALQFVDDDENLFYNLSRVHYERGDWKECITALKASLQLNPSLEAALGLSKLLFEMVGDYKLRQKRGKPDIPRDAASLILTLHDTARQSNHAEVLQPEKGRVRASGVITIDSHSCIKEK